MYNDTSWSAQIARRYWTELQVPSAALSYQTCSQFAPVLIMLCEEISIVHIAFSALNSCEYCVGFQSKRKSLREQTSSLKTVHIRHRFVSESTKTANGQSKSANVAAAMHIVRVKAQESPENVKCYFHTVISVSKSKFKKRRCTIIADD